MTKLEILTPRLQLCTPTEDDLLPVYLELNLTEDIAENTVSIPYPFSLEDAARWIERAQESLREASAWVFVLRERNAGTVIGAVGIHRDEKNPRTAETGYWISLNHRGQGYATEALAAATQYALETLGMERVFADCFVENPASRKVLEKAGYTYEGLREQSIEKNGVLRDAHRLYKTKATR